MCSKQALNIWTFLEFSVTWNTFDFSSVPGLVWLFCVSDGLALAGSELQKQARGLAVTIAGLIWFEGDRDTREELLWGHCLDKVCVRACVCVCVCHCVWLCVWLHARERARFLTVLFTRRETIYCDCIHVERKRERKRERHYPTVKQSFAWHSSVIYSCLGLFVELIWLNYHHIWGCGVKKIWAFSLNMQLQKNQKGPHFKKRLCFGLSSSRLFKILLWLSCY